MAPPTQPSSAKTLQEKKQFLIETRRFLSQFRSAESDFADPISNQRISGIRHNFELVADWIAKENIHFDFDNESIHNDLFMEKLDQLIENLEEDIDFTRNDEEDKRQKRIEVTVPLRHSIIYEASREESELSKVKVGASLGNSFIADQRNSGSLIRN